MLNEIQATRSIPKHTKLSCGAKLATWRLADKYKTTTKTLV